MRNRPLLVLVGGFLGAGKTSLLLKAARTLSSRGLKTAIITNDQAESLVDTAMASKASEWISEVAGGCFCCRFDVLMTAAEELAGHHPDVIFAEPVGSCTDLVATVLKPIKDLYAAEYRLAPLSVLVDPDRANQIGDGTDEIAFLFGKQIEEADLICFTKSDLNVPIPSLRVHKPLRSLSAKTGEGVEAWLDEISSGQISVATQLIEVDYARYAKAEAALGWLNATIEFEMDVPISPPAIVGPLMDQIDRLLTAKTIAIVHLKLIDETPFGFLKAGVCSNGNEPEIEGDLLSPPVSRHRVTVNLRAHTEPEVLRSTLSAALGSMPRNQTVLALSAFRPAPPQPVHRYV